MKKYLFAISILTSFYLNAQNGSVGINTENPQATLHVVGNPTDTSKFDGIIPPKITGDELGAKSYTSSQIGALVYVTNPATSPSGQVINVTSTDYYYFDGVVWQAFKPALYDVVMRGNYSPKYISFTGDSSTKLGTLEGAVGYNATTKSHYFSTMNQTQSGLYNESIGYGSLNTLTTGHRNIAIGYNTLNLNTTGFENTVIGNNAGTANINFPENVYIGSESGKLLNGDYNTMVGAYTASALTTGRQNTLMGNGVLLEANILSSYNTAIGNNALRKRTSSFGNIAIGRDVAVATSGDNNVYIGNGAGRTSLTTGLNSTNKLIIHSSAINSAGNYPSGLVGANALIYGDFSTRFLQINGNLLLNPTYMKTADGTYNKTILYNSSTGDIGVSSTITVPVPPTTGNYILKSLNGVVTWVAE